MARGEREQLSVVMFPWLAHGHITPFLELARRLTTSADRRHDLDVVVHLVSTPVNVAAIAARRRDDDDDSRRRIRLVELHLPEQPDLPPPTLHTTKHLPARLMPALKRACDLAAPRFGALLDSLRPDLVLYDFLQPWAPLEAERRGIPAAHFSTCSVAATAFFLHHRHRRLLGSDTSFPFEDIGLGSADEESKYTDDLFLTRDDDGTSAAAAALVPERDRLSLSLARSSGFVAVKTCADIERPYMDYLSHLLGGNKEIIPCGPLLVVDDHDGSTDSVDRVMRWLDEQDQGSVLLVSFGSEYFMSEQQIAQVARGLELAGERFVWVVRFPNHKSKSNDDDDRAGWLALRALCSSGISSTGKGLVVEGWAPQRRVLDHPACGAFLTHCGWSSVMESLAAGVPMVALPLHIDQPLNANLVAGAAVRVTQRRFGEFRAEDVARAVRAVMRRGGDEGEAVRRRARELREVVMRDDADDAWVGALLQRMARLCGKGKAMDRR